jgi:hypothetical protein
MPEIKEQSGQQGQESEVISPFVHKTPWEKMTYKSQGM